MAYIRSNGLAPDTPNMTVSSMGGHPKVQGNGYVPYTLGWPPKLLTVKLGASGASFFPRM